MTAEWIAGWAGALFSLLTAYVPGLRERFESLDGVRKRLVMLALITVAALGALGLNCLRLEAGAWYLTCEAQGLSRLFSAWLAAAMANQAAYTMGVRR